jgi:hypothetical protein
MRAMREAKELGKREEYEFAMGGLLGTVDIIGSVTEHDSVFFAGPHGWMLSRPRPFKKIIPYRGAVGIFYVPRHLLAGTSAAAARPGSITR